MSELKVNRITDTDGNEVLKSTSGTWSTSLGILNVNSGTISNSTISGSTLASTNTFPAGHIIQVIQTQFNHAVTETGSNTYQSTPTVAVIHKTLTNSKILAMLQGGSCGVTQSYYNSCIMTIIQESSSSIFTPSTTYSSTNDPTNNSTQGMSVHNNKVNKNLFPHSIVWLFDSSGFEYEGYRVYFKSERGGYPAVYHEGTTSYLTFTLMEISQ